MIRRRAPSDPRPRASPTQLGERGLACVAVLLSAVAGYLDAVGWILLAHVYVANMSGNTIAVGRAISRGDGFEMAARIWPIVVFVSGLFASELLYELCRRRGRRSSAAWTLGLESVVVILVGLLPWPEPTLKGGVGYYVPTGLLCFAMGLQNATLVRVGASSVYTTHVTGTLTRMSREGVHALLWIGDRARGRTAGRVRDHRPARRVFLCAALWILYCVGALFGSLAADHWQRRGALMALIVLVSLTAFDLVRPIGGHETPREPHPMF